MLLGGCDEFGVSCAAEPVVDGAGGVVGEGLAYGFGWGSAGLRLLESVVVDVGDLLEAVGVSGVAWAASWAAGAFA